MAVPTASTSMGVLQTGSAQPEVDTCPRAKGTPVLPVCWGGGAGGVEREREGLIPLPLVPIRAGEAWAQMARAAAAPP